MAGNAERLAIDLEARVTDLEKGMKKAQAIASKAYSGMKRDSKTATDRMETDMVKSTSGMNRALAATSTKVGALGKAMIVGFASGLVAGGIAGVVTRIGQLAGEVAAVGDEARRAGLSLKAFQELKYVAEQNRVSVGALTDGMKELNLRADEFIVTGGGSAAEAFQRLGYSAEELNTKLQDPSALFTEIIGKLGDLDRAAQIRIADELFGGTGGEQFVQLIGQGEEGIRRTIAEANSLGIVMSDQMVAKAAEVDRKFNQIANTVGSAVRGAIVDAAGALNDFLNTLGETPAMHFGDINARIQEQVQLIHDLGAAGGREFPELSNQLDLITGSVTATGDGAVEAKVALMELATNPDYAPLIGDLNGVISTLVNLTGQAREAAAAVAASTRKDLGVEDVTWGNLQTFANPPPRTPRTVPGSGASGGRSSAASEAEREAKAIQNLITGLEFERSLIGLSALDQEKLNALRQAGASATAEQRAQISNLVEATYREREAAQLATDQMQALSDIGVDAAQSLADAFSDGRIEASELLSIVGDIVKQLLAMPSGGGGGGNWISNILGGLMGGMGGGVGGGPVRLGFNLPGYADGTANTGGRRGEPRGTVHGQEAVIPLPNGGRVPVQITSPSVGQLQKVHVTVGLTTDAAGNIRPFVEKVAQDMLEGYDQAMPSKIDGVMRRAKDDPLARISHW